MASSAARKFTWQNAKQVRSKIKIPEKVKGGRLEKIGGYLMNILSDYKSVAVETLQDMQEKPLKASIYLSGLATVGLLIKTTPDSQSFRVRLQTAANDLSLVNDLVRNPHANEHVLKLAQAQKDGTLKYQNFGLFSVMWIDFFPSGMGLFEANCSHLKTPWHRFHEAIVDVGYLGGWKEIEKQMKDYDINPTEWTSTATS